MERTRDEVVRILHDCGAVSVTEVAQSIGISAGSARRHLDIMAAEGLVEMRLDRQPRGRPVTRYSLSEEGEERSGSVHYARMLDRIYPALTGLHTDEVSGQSGAAVLARVFDGIAEAVARSYAPRVRSIELVDRVPEVAAALRDEGILTDVIDEDGRYRLLNVGCPYRSTAEGSHVACDADRRTIELLLGEPVQQLTTIVAGASCCEYVVSKHATTVAELLPIEAVPTSREAVPTPRGPAGLEHTTTGHAR